MYTIHTPGLNIEVAEPGTFFQMSASNMQFGSKYILELNIITTVNQ